jgi:hypothetical protein
VGHPAGRMPHGHGRADLGGWTGLGGIGGGGHLSGLGGGLHHPVLSAPMSSRYGMGGGGGLGSFPGGGGYGGMRGGGNLPSGGLPNHLGGFAPMSGLSMTKTKSAMSSISATNLELDIDDIWGEDFPEAIEFAAQISNGGGDDEGDTSRQDGMGGDGDGAGGAGRDDGHKDGANRGLAGSDGSSGEHCDAEGGDGLCDVQPTPSTAEGMAGVASLGSGYGGIERSDTTPSISSSSATQAPSDSGDERRPWDPETDGHAQLSISRRAARGAGSDEDKDAPSSSLKRRRAAAPTDKSVGSADASSARSLRQRAA